MSQIIYKKGNVYVMLDIEEVKINDIIICLVGESGSGKTTIAELLEKKGYNYIESYTTRKPRYNGERGHIFVDKIIDKKDMIAPGYYQNNWYWTTKKQYQNKGISIYPIEPTGIEFLKNNIKDAKIIVIYLKVDKEIRKQRMLERENQIDLAINYTNICSNIMVKLSNDDNQFDFVPCDYVINANKSIEEVLALINKCIEKSFQLN